MALALAGTFGSVYIPGTPLTPIASLRSWDMTITADNYDASVLGDTWREFVSGLKGWNGTMSGYYSLVTDPNGQGVLFNALTNNSSVVCVFQTVQGGGSLEGTVHLTQAQISDPVDNLITMNFTYVGTGSLQHLP